MKKFLYEKVFQSLLDNITSGVYPSGSLLPSEKELCNMYDMSLITVRRALKELEELGVITKVKGKGSIVNSDSRKSTKLSDFGNDIGVLDLDFSDRSYREYPPTPFDKDIYNKNRWKNLIWSSVFSTLSSSYNLLLSSHKKQNLIENFEHTVFAAVSRILILGEYDKELIDFLHDKGKCVVVHNNFDKSINVCSVANQDRLAFYTLTKRLIDAGHQKIAVINGNISFRESVERYMGFQTALAEKGIEIESKMIEWGNLTFESGYYSMNQILDNNRERPTAVACVNDNVAAGVIVALQERGLKCPDDICVFGHDNNSDMADLITVPITSVDPQYTIIGREIANKLIRPVWVDDETIVESKIIIRDSTGQI